MSEIKLFCDSCCDLNEELQKKTSAELIPLIITVGEKEFIDDENLNLSEMLTSVDNCSTAPQSSCPSIGLYEEKLSKALKCFVVTLSKHLSGSYNSAVNAAKILTEKLPGREICVVDSKSASAGEVLVALKISEYIEKNLPFDKIKEKIFDFVNNMKTFFVLENLDTLRKNGRLGLVTGIIANVLSIRPIMGSDGNGSIKLYERHRGFFNSLARMVDMIGEQTKTTEDKTLVIAHCDNHERALSVREMILRKYKFKEILIVATRGLSSIYANRGGIVIAY